MLQLRQQAVALQKAAAASEGVQEELRRQLELAKQQCRELQKQLEAHMQDSNATLAQAQQHQQELQHQLAEAARKHTQEVQQHRYWTVAGSAAVAQLVYADGWDSMASVSPISKQQPTGANKDSNQPDLYTLLLHTVRRACVWLCLQCLHAPR